MVNFTEEFRERMRKDLAYYADVDKRRTIAKVSVTVNKLDNMLSEASAPDSGKKWVSDEDGPSPLAYFLSSMAMCQCVHYAEHAAAENIRLDSLRIEVRGFFTVNHPRSFEEIEYTVYVNSPEEQTIIKRLARTASEDCFVTNTLKKASKVKGSLVLNGSLRGVFDETLVATSHEY